VDLRISSTLKSQILKSSDPQTLKLVGNFVMRHDAIEIDQPIASSSGATTRAK
jgi:hypothetical protein